MNTTAVASTTLTTVGYDDSGCVLQLEFRSRAVYRYFGVPAAVHQSLLDASSKGRFFSRAIRGQFRFVRISGPRVDAAGMESAVGRRR